MHAGREGSALREVRSQKGWSVEALSGGRGSGSVAHVMMPVRIRLIPVPTTGHLFTGLLCQGEVAQPGTIPPALPRAQSPERESC